MNNRTLARTAAPGSFRRLVLGTALLLALDRLARAAQPRGVRAGREAGRRRPDGRRAGHAGAAGAAGRTRQGRQRRTANAKSSVSAKIDVSTDKAGNSTVTIEKSGADPSTDADV